jgi:hypothetical protein
MEKTIRITNRPDYLHLAGYLHELPGHFYIDVNGYRIHYQNFRPIARIHRESQIVELADNLNKDIKKDIKKILPKKS